MSVSFNSQTLEELRVLLSELQVSDIQIHCNGREVSVREFQTLHRRYRSGVWINGRTDLLNQTLDKYADRCEIELSNHEKQARLLSLLRLFFTDYIVNDAIDLLITRITGGIKTFTINDVLRDILWLRMLLGVDTALSTLKETGIPYLHIFYVPGMMMEKNEQIPLIIDENTRIYPTKTERYKQYDFKSGEFIEYDETNNCRIIGSCTPSERFAAPNNDYTNDRFKEDYDCPVERVRIFLQMLSLVKVAVIQYREHQCCARSQELGLPFSSGRAISLEGRLPSFGTTRVRQNDVDKAKHLSDRYELLSEDMKNKLDPAIILWQLYANLKGYLSFSDRLYNTSMLKTATEIIFPSNKRFCETRLDQYLGKTDAEWSDLKEKYKIFRHYRNDLVHDNPIRNDFETEIRPALDCIERCFCEVMMKIINDVKFPDAAN